VRIPGAGKLRRAVLRALDGVPRHEAVLAGERGSLERTLRRLAAFGLDARRVVDVGAHKGMWTLEAIAVWPSARYLLVEPQRELVERKGRLRDDSRVTWCFVGAAPESGEATFAHYPQAVSSTFKPVEGLAISEETVPVRRIDELVNEHFGPGAVPDILKLDCEGWDLDVLEGAGSLVGRIPVLFLEAGVSNRSFEASNVGAVVARLESLDYRLFDVSGFIRTHRDGLWNVELCFVRRGIAVDDASSSWPAFDRTAEAVQRP